MLFSVIIPVFNVEKYLKECVDSVLKQTFTDYELILVDDGSTDTSGALCDKFAAANDKIKVIHKENGGAADSRNVGIRAALGDYIICLDSDDYVIEEDFFADIKEKLSKTDADIVLYKYCQFTDGETKLQPCTFSFSTASSAKSSDELLAAIVKADAFYAAAWNKVVRRILLKDNNIEFEVGITGEDNEWYLHLLTSAECRFAVIDKPYIAYRQRAGSVTKTIKLKNLTDYIYVLEKWDKGISNAPISERRKEALYGAMAKYYANLLIVYSRTKDKDKKSYKKRVKALSHLLKYAKSSRPKTILKIYSLIGFEGTVLSLKILDMLKG